MTRVAASPPLAVADLDATLAELAGRGIAAGPIEPQGDAARKAIVVDPDGNALPLIEVDTGA